jgi:signal transduction histidine kinase
MKQREQKQFWALCTLYLLAAYILFQIVWWGSHIVNLTTQLGTLRNDPTQRARVLAMVWGEGSVFALLLFTGFFSIHRTLRKEFRFAKVQSAFLLSVTHELKTPVAALKLGLDTMKQRQLSDDQRHQLLSSMSKEAMRLQLLSENIVLAARLDLRLEEILNESIHLSELIQKHN